MGVGCGWGEMGRYEGELGWWEGVECVGVRCFLFAFCLFVVDSVNVWRKRDVI